MIVGQSPIHTHDKEGVGVGEIVSRHTDFVRHSQNRRGPATNFAVGRTILFRGLPGCGAAVFAACRYTEAFGLPSSTAKQAVSVQA